MMAKRWAWWWIGLALACAAPRPASVSPSVENFDAHFFELPAALQAQPESLTIAPLRFDPPAPQVEILPSGLKIYLLEDHSVPLVQLRALVNFGSVDDPQEKIGLAQVTLATLQTGGAGKNGADETDNLLEQMAAKLETEASDEHSDVALELRASDWEHGLGLFFDLLQRPRFAPKPLAQVLEQCREAIRRREEIPSSVALRTVQKAVWGERSPFAREATLQSVNRISRKDLINIHAAAFVPNATRLIITGDFVPAQVLARVRMLTRDWKRGPGINRQLPAALGPHQRRVILVPSANATVKIRIGQLGVARHHSQEYALRLLDAAIGGGLGSSRLYSEIRDRRGLAYSVDSTMVSTSSSGLFVVSVDTGPQTAIEVITRTLAVMDGARGTTPISDAEVELAKDSFVNAFAFHFDTASRAAYQWALHDAYGYPADYLKNFRARIQAVTAEQINSAALELLKPDTLQIVVVGNPAQLGDLSRFGQVQVVENIDHVAW